MPKRPKPFGLLGISFSGNMFSAGLSRSGSKVSSRQFPTGIAQATAERDQPVGFFSLLRRFGSKDSFRGLAAAVDFLQAFGRHLHSLESSNSQLEKI